MFQLITPKFPAVVKIGHAHSGVGKVSWVPNHFANYWLIYDTMYRKKPMSCRLPIILQIKVNFHFIFLGVFGSLISGLLLNLFDIHQVGIIFLTKIFQLVWRQHFQEHLLLKLITMWTVIHVYCISRYQRKMIIRKADIKFTLKFTWNWCASFSHQIHMTCLNW